MEETWERVAVPGALPWAPPAWLGPPALPYLSGRAAPRQRPKFLPSGPRPLARRAPLPRWPHVLCLHLRGGGARRRGRRSRYKVSRPRPIGRQFRPTPRASGPAPGSTPCREGPPGFARVLGRRRSSWGSRSNREFRGVRRRSRAWLCVSSSPGRSGARVWGVVGCGESLEEKAPRPSCPRGQEKAVTFD